MSQHIQFVLAETSADVVAQKKRWPWLFLVAMRPHQWAKNLFILAPLLFAKKLTDPSSLGYSFFAFVVFCALASGLYIFNDWIDIEEDRAHPEKRNRPLSSGLLSFQVALFGATVLVAVGLVMAAFISLNFFLVAALYFVLTLGYCLGLKQVMILLSLIHI